MNRRVDPDLVEPLATIDLVVFDFDGVFTDNTVYVSDDGMESVRCWRGDGLGLARLAEVGVDAHVLSTEVNPVVGRRCAKLRIPCTQACEDKASALLEIARVAMTPLDRTAYLGNDTNDRGCLELVRLPVVVADAHPDVTGSALLTTTAAGGRGAVRELCDLIVAAKRGVL